MRRSLSWIVLLLTATSLHAAEQGGWVTPDELRISREDCRRLVRHEPAPDVAYQPGVDVRGRPVAPADLSEAPQVRLPDEIVIPLAVDVMKGRRSGSAVDAYAGVGTLTVRNGRAYFNDEPLHGWEQEILLEACRKHGIR